MNADAQINRSEMFRRFCPPLFLETELKRLPQPQLNEALAWRYGPAGLLLVGDTGKGKTRVAWALCWRVAVRDQPEREVVWLSAVELGRKIENRTVKESANEWMENLKRVSILFIDGLGFENAERSRQIHYLIATRWSFWNLPTIITTTQPALIRRLREFCKPIQF
jgi:DNA replication protein DnaC